MEKKPGRHGRHEAADVELRSDEKYPAPQPMHCVAAKNDEKRPAEQLAHADKPGVEYCPGPHRSHAVAPLCPTKNPEEHGEQASALERPCEMEYRPASQREQLCIPERLEYSPAAQVLHSVAPSGENCPAAQLMQTLDDVAFATIDAVPAAQGTHAPVIAGE